MLGGGLGGVGAMIAGTAVVKMIPDFSGFGNKLNSEMSGFGQRASAIGGSLTKGLTLPIVGIGVAAVKAFGDAQKVAAQTEAVIKSTGGAAGVTAAEVADLATSLSKKTAADDEAIQSGANLLLTFTNVRNEAGKGNDVFNQATATILDMSQALGQDTKASAIQLGKALNDPIKGVTALQRVGVSFTASQKEQIKTLVESGHTLEAQKLILAELNKEFGGSAEAFAQTAEGRMKTALNELGNAAESLGSILLPVITTVTGFITRLATAFQNLSPGTQKFIAGILAVVAAVGPAILIAAKLSTALSTLAPVFGLVGKAAMLLFANPIGIAIAAVIVIAILLIKHWDKVKAALSAVWNFLKAAASKVFSLIATAAKVGLLGPIPFIIANWSKVKSVLVGIWNFIVSAARTAWNTVKSIVLGAINTIKSAVGGLVDAVQSLPFVPGSPIPMVVGAKASARALGALGNAMRRLPVIEAPALGAARAAAAAGSTPAGGVSTTDARSFQLAVTTRQSLGSIKADFRLMEAMAG